MQCGRILSRSRSRLGSRAISTGRPDVLQCRDATLYRFGDPTSDTSRALFANLNWIIADASVTPDAASPAWALIGPKSTLLADAALLGRARADPPHSRAWPFLRDRPIDSVIQKVSFSTRLESKAVGATAGEFIDYTARYFSVKADDEDATTLRAHLERHAAQDDLQSSTDSGRGVVETARLLQLEPFLDLQLVALSNGQTRRARIARALLKKPEVLILDEPFTGLDVKSRTLIADLLGNLHAKRSPRIVLVLRPQDTLPDWVDSIAESSTDYIGTRGNWSQTESAVAMPTTVSGGLGRRRVATEDATPVFAVERASISYKDRHVLKEISWQIRAGDRVVLTGANGSGKSTLLSLILGDHPASFSQSLSLFGQRRSEHSTYSLSMRTGHYSPELYAAFPRRHGEAGLSIYETIGTGFDNIFSYRRLSSEQKERIDALLQAFDPDQTIFTDTFRHKTLFAEAEPPMQALALVLRALVKSPDLLILDEPFAGMDSETVQRCRRFLDEELLEHQSMVFISHYEEEWPETIGKRLHLEDGRAVESLL